MSASPSNLNIIGLHEMYFPVTNLEASVGWYTRNFGMTVGDRSEKQVTLTLAEGSRLTLVESDQLNRWDSPPIGFKAHDPRKAHSQLNTTEVRAQEPESFHHYVDFDVWDPDGNVFNVISEPAWPDTPNNYFRIDGVFLGVANFERMFAWYCDILGAQIEYAFTHPTDTLPEARFRSFRGIPFNLVESPTAVMRHRVCDFRTTNAAQDYAYLQSKGVPVSQVFENDGERRFTFSDPEGHELGVVEFL